MGLASSVLGAAEPKQNKQKKAAAPGPSFAKKSKMKLGTVSYNLAMDWDIATIIKH